MPRHRTACVFSCVASFLSSPALEGVRAVRAHHKQELEQQLIRVRKPRARRIGKTPEAVLATDLAELAWPIREDSRSEEHTSELQSLAYLVCRLLLETKNIPIEVAECAG